MKLRIRGYEADNHLLTDEINVSLSDEVIC